MHCINACHTASPFPQVFLTSRSDHKTKTSHIPYFNYQFNRTVCTLTQPSTMGIPTRGDKNRISKCKLAPRKKWTEAVKEKIVQFLTSEQLLHGPFAEKPKSLQSAALQDALECTQCRDLHIIPYMMNADIAKGSYITSQYPPFFASKSTVDDYISPFDPDVVVHESNNTTFWEDITPAQQQRYYDKIDTILKKAEAESGKPIDEATVLFAHYQVDFHIRQHYLTPRSILNLCRSKDDIRALTHWQWKSAVADETAFAEVPDWGMGWAHEPSNSLGHQIAAWRMGERSREKHLAEVEARWAEIKDERQKQRMRTIKILFKGEHIRTYQYEPCEPCLTEKEIMDITTARGEHYEAFLDAMDT
ncbi:unnamed protein product [Penicillium egyptiacum]|uniref:Uncharacterized protein n=1 Tax=Penicillium egyptiacum TaxID=1303716 RepID=A0A9W4P3J0_9EURO|nr:unnamed protein product [Penicillium egyptiacum]